MFEPSERLWQVWGLLLNVILPLLLSFWGLSFALGYGMSLQSLSSAALVTLQRQVQVLTPSTCECNLSWKRVFANDYIVVVVQSLSSV